MSELNDIIKEFLKNMEKLLAYRLENTAHETEALKVHLQGLREKKSEIFSSNESNNSIGFDFQPEILEGITKYNATLQRAANERHDKIDEVAQCFEQWCATTADGPEAYGFGDAFTLAPYHVVEAEVQRLTLENEKVSAEIEAYKKKAEAKLSVTNDEINKISELATSLLPYVQESRDQRERLRKELEQLNISDFENQADNKLIEDLEKENADLKEQLEQLKIN